LRIARLQLLVGLVGFYAGYILLYAFFLLLLKDAQFLGGFVFQTKRAKHRGKLKSRLARIGTQLERCFELRTRLGRAVEAGKHKSQAVTRVEVVRVDRNGLAQVLLSVGVVAQSLRHHSAEVERVELLGPSLPVAIDQRLRLVELAQNHQRLDVRQAGDVVRRVKPQRLMKLLCCLAVTVLLDVDRSQIEVPLCVVRMRFDDGG
jgi:hypothetical protein